MLLVLVVAGLVLHRKNRFAWACGCCVLLSILIEVVVGWGSNGGTMIVFSYYFSWAYVALVCMALFRMLERFPKIQAVLFAALILTIFAVNLSELIKIVSFGIEHYPYLL